MLKPPGIFLFALSSLNLAAVSEASPRSVTIRTLPQKKIEQLVYSSRLEKWWKISIAERYLKYNAEALSGMPEPHLKAALAHFAETQVPRSVNADGGLRARVAAALAAEKQDDPAFLKWIWNDASLKALDRALECNLFGVAELDGPALLNGARELYELERIGSSSRPDLRQIAAWARSRRHLAYLYRNAGNLFGANALRVVRWIARETPFLEDARKLDGMDSWVMMAFEKETPKPAISRLFRLPWYSEKQWDLIPPKTRQEMLIKTANEHLLGVHRKGTPAGLARLGLDGTEGIHEMRTALGEPDLPRLLSEMRQVSEALDEENGFHVHMVFDAPKSLLNNRRFKLWIKLITDSIFLKELARGVAPSNKAVLQSDLNLITGIKDQLIGVRHGIYGKSHLPGHIRIGLEFRDLFDGNFSQWEKTLARVREGIATRAWERLDSEELTMFTRVNGLFDSKEELVKIGFDPSLLASVFTEKVSVLPFQDLTQGRFADLTTGIPFELTQSQKDRLVEAYGKYLLRSFKFQEKLKSTPPASDEIQERYNSGKSIERLGLWAQESGLIEILDRW